MQTTQRLHRAPRGFSFLEILVALGIVALLAQVAITAYGRYVARARAADLELVFDQMKTRTGVATRGSDLRVFAHLSATHCTVSIDTSGEPLFKRGWREDKGDAPLKETLAAAMIAASGWSSQCEQGVPLYDPCCGSGTIAIEAAQVACNMAPGGLRRFGFEKLLPFQAHVWDAMKSEAHAAVHAPTAAVFGSDVAFRMVDFAERNAQRAGVGAAVQLRGGDALQRMPPTLPHALSQGVHRLGATPWGAIVLALAARERPRASVLRLPHSAP